MTKTKTLTALGATFALAVSFPAVGLASTGYAPALQAYSGTQSATPGNAQEAPTQPGSGRIRPSRRNQNSSREAAPTPPTPEQNLAAAQTIATSASSNCQVTQANLLGQTEAGPMYEAACATGPGFIFVASTPPQAIDCVQLTSSARISRERDPAAEVGIQCVIPANVDILPVLAAYAKTAGVSCTPDEGLAIGKAPNGNLIYEIGCAGQDGYWLEQTGATFTKTECMRVVTQNGTCRFTKAEEQAATLKAALAGSPAAACDVQQARYMGGNANGTFYEAKCAAGDGYIARMNAESVVQQTYPCAEAQRIGGGCKLTEVAPAPEATTPAPAAQ